MTDEKEIDEQAADDTVEQAQSELSAARERFGEVIGGVEKKVRGFKKGAGKASEQVKERAGRVSAVAKEKYSVAREGARQGYDKVTKDMDQLGQDVNEYVRHNPGKSVAIALGVGFVLGMLLRPRRD
jgi:ElaB/YqjD/DUF883 family membrane-anchored ribosome-binding protein